MASGSCGGRAALALESGAGHRLPHGDFLRLLGEGVLLFLLEELAVHQGGARDLGLRIGEHRVLGVPGEFGEQETGREAAHERLCLVVARGEADAAKQRVALDETTLLRLDAAVDALSVPRLPEPHRLGRVLTALGADDESRRRHQRSAADGARSDGLGERGHDGRDIGAVRGEDRRRAGAEPVPHDADSSGIRAEIAGAEVRVEHRLDRIRERVDVRRLLGEEPGTGIGSDHDETPGSEVLEGVLVVLARLGPVVSEGEQRSPPRVQPRYVDLAGDAREAEIAEVDIVPATTAERTYEFLRLLSHAHKVNVYRR